MKALKQLPNLLTSANLFSGTLGIVFAFNGDYTNSIFFILLSALFDFFDGFAARAVGASGDFGKELDSLADMVSFGVLPAIYMYQLLRTSYHNEYIPYAGLLIAVFSALRLAKFNIDENQDDKFIGLPTPANAIMITTLGQLPEFIRDIPHLFPVVTALSCFLLISPVEMIALKFKNYNLRTNIAKYLLLILLAIFVVLLRIEALPFIIPLYVIISLIAALTIKKEQ